MGPTPFTFTFQGASSASELQTVYGLLNTGIEAWSACYFSYYRPGNLLFLYPYNGDGTQAQSMSLSGRRTLSNGQCTISAVGASAVSNGQTLTLPITFKQAFTGNRAWWLAAITLPNAQNQTSNWEAHGAWQLPAQ